MPLGEPMKKKTVLITGGTGSLGQALAFNLAKTNHVRIYSRNIVLSREEKSFLVKKIDPKVSKNFDSSTADSFSNSEIDSILLKLTNKS